jgi:type IV pilus assembly protein PilB
MKKKRLGEVLRERGHVSAVELDKALEEQRQQAKLIHLGELMLKRGVVAKEDLISALTEVSSVPYFDCTQAEPKPELLQLIPADMARRCLAIPVDTEDSAVVVAMAEPQNLRALDELRFKIGKKIVPRLAFHGELTRAIDKYYGLPEPQAQYARSGAPHEQEKEIEFVSFSEQQRNVQAMREMEAELNQKSKTTPAVLLVASIIKAAAMKKASDIHIEPQATDTAIRLRVDGMLREYQRIPRALQHTVISRIKILADMNIAERRAPQDGRFLVRIGDRRIDLRISSLPTQYGEKIVMRLLEQDALQHDFAALGCPLWVEDHLKRMLQLPQGMILVTGPTGSGKTTTLYTALTFVRKPSINIITVEDPVEYALAGLNQVQVNTKAGMTFGTCLRSILRQDPNVIMIGEIRDIETAEIALKAAQTGHLVLSTLHTNDSFSAVTRLLDLGVPAFQIATSLTGILAQRLIRRLCACHKTLPATSGFTAKLLQLGVSDAPSMENSPVGCAECDMTGYKGRIGIYELLVFDDAIRSLVREGGANDHVRALARRQGMRLMNEYALDYVVEGRTTLEEVQRVVHIEQPGRSSCPSCQRELAAGFAFCPFCGERAGLDRAPHSFVAEKVVSQ